MKRHLIISLLAVVMAIPSVFADVVYEPLIVVSGFNRDCIAETTSIGSSAWSPLYDLTSGNAHTSCFGTRSVIASINATQGFTDEDYAKTIAGGWPDDYGNPDDRVIRCSTEYLADAYQNPTFANVYWRLAPYDEPNVLTLRPANEQGGSDETKGWFTSGTLTFQKIGCYDQLFFLMASLRQGSGVGQRKVTTVVHYTDGTTSNQEFLFAGLGGEVGQRVQITNVYESPFKKNTVKDPNNAYVSVFPMDVNPHKLIESIEFTNNITNTSAIIFAVTGRTADIAAPEDEGSETGSITSTSFEACWEAVTEAASYRLDVAEDIDFQHILEDYNNKVITGTTCEEVANLVANNDYYWRVRSVNSDGGQSASSAPRRVRMQAPEGPQTENEESTDIETNMTALLDATTNLNIHRTLYKDGCFNTLCLPFSIDAAGIAESPLAGCQLYTFDHADVLGDAQLDVHMSETDAIEAGVPYLIKWANTGEVITDLTFTGVTITTDHGQTVGEEGEVQFVGNIATAALTINDHHLLFVGGNNTLYWPNTDLGLKGFRAYFSVPAIGSVAVRRGIPARIVTQKNTPTALESIATMPACTKILHNGQVVIIRNGIRFNVLGQTQGKEADL